MHGKWSNPMTDQDTCTDAELQHAMAHLLAHARGEVLNDAEVQRFWQLYGEIVRRREAAGTAA